jgi:DNA invertase Pin-like site-specific DNA recombinase
MRPNLDTSKYAVIYPRQSTPDQVENNVYSLERQMLLRDQAARDGFPEEHIIVIEDDIGMSGRSIVTRPGFSRALKMMAQGVVGALYAEDLTRLSRDESTRDQMEIASVCERYGVMLYFGRSWYDMRDSGQRQSYKYQAVGASEYWKAHVAKMQADKRQKALAGKAVAGVPRGYRINKGTGKHDPERDRLIVHEPEAEVIRSLIARLPEARSMTALYKLTHPTYWPDGSLVTFKAIRHICGSPVYRGTYAWGDIEVPGSHPAILTPEDVATIERLNALNKAVKRKQGDNEGALLSGLVWCPACSRKVQSNTNNRSSGYRCASHSNAAVRDNHFQVHSGRIDELVLTDLWRRLQGNLIDSIMGHLRKQKAAIINIQGAGEAQRRTLQKRVDGLASSLADPDLSDLARKVLIQQLNEATRNLEEMVSQTPAAKHIDADLVFYEGLLRDRDHIEMLPVTWSDEPLIWRRGFVRHFIERVELTIHPRHVDIVVLYRDGASSTVKLGRRMGTKGSHPNWEPAERLALQNLLASPDRPGRGLYRWVSEQLASMDYDRSAQAVFKMVKAMRQGGSPSPRLAATGGPSQDLAPPLA